MSRKRALPALEKPVFDAAAALRFAVAKPAAGLPAGSPVAGPAAPRPRARRGCVRLELDLPAEAHARLLAAARRKERSPAEVVERLIRKHL